MSAFKTLQLSENLLKSIAELGFESPSDIQLKSIPILVQGQKDFIGLAQTGTGKTAAFGLPLLDKIDTQSKDTQALILAPTRELGQQIAEQLKLYSKYLEKINILAVYGGAAIYEQIKALKKNQHIIIATPGRLYDLIRRKSADLSKIKYLILDEADEMLNMGFKEELDAILSYTPHNKNTWLFSATMPNEIQKIVASNMKDPVEVRVNPKNKVNTNIDHFYVNVKPRDKTEALSRFLDVNPDMRGLVFCRTKNDAQNLAESLIKKNYRADSLHGDLSQLQRDRVMKRFKAQDLHVLIATDVAARGIDVNDLTHVFHFSLPDGKEYYTHRSGRTARAGKKGASIAFVGGKENFKIQRIATQLNIQFEQAFIPDAEEIQRVRIENWCNTIMETPVKEPINGALLKKVGNLFKDVSKHELLEKLIFSELSKVKTENSHDINDKETGPSEGRTNRKYSRDKYKRGKYNSQTEDGLPEKRNFKKRDRSPKPNSEFSGERGDKRKFGSGKKRTSEKPFAATEGSSQKSKLPKGSVRGKSRKSAPGADGSMGEAEVRKKKPHRGKGATTTSKPPKKSKRKKDSKKR